MNKILYRLLLAGVLVAFFSACSLSLGSDDAVTEDDMVMDLTQGIAISEEEALRQIEQSSSGVDASGILFPRLTLVTLRGKVFEFGVDVFTGEFKEHGAGEPDTHIWFAEYPFTRFLNVRSDAQGEWEVKILKRADRPLDLSIVYNKDFFDAATEDRFNAISGIPIQYRDVTVKSETFIVENEDITDRAIQLPDELYLTAAAFDVEQAIRAATGDPNYTIDTILVTTIGKSWASMTDDRLPHGDPGAFLINADTGEVLLPNSPLITLYFNEQVVPDPTQIGSSVDGGVALFNAPNGVYNFSAVKAGFDYGTITFGVEDDFYLYISSPPQAVIGTNTSDPGEF